MRVNPRVFEEKSDMFNSIQIPSCPTVIREIAERIMNLPRPDGRGIWAVKGGKIGKNGRQIEQRRT